MRTRSHKTHRRLAGLGAALLLSLACGGHEPAAPAASAATVRAGLARAERTEAPGTLELAGTVEAGKTATAAARVMAMVTAVHVDTGEPVHKGQPLIDLDPQASQGQLAQAAGALAQARAALALAERNFERFEALAAADAASQLEVDVARAQLEQARGAVEQAAGAVAAASSLAADSRVVAPFSGRVARKMVEVGDLAAPGRPLLVVESQDSPRLILSVPESVMARARLELGDTLSVRLDARPELGALAAEIVEMTAGADPVSHSFEIELALPLDEAASGAAGRAAVEIDRRTVVAVPESAVLRQGGLALVVVRDAEGNAGSRVVTLGETLAEGRVEVLSGLAGGETVLLGLAAVPPAGTRIEPLAAQGQAS